MKLSLSLQLLVVAVSALTTRVPNVADEIKARLSPSSSVAVDLRARWSAFNAPVPAIVVNVTTEKDVAAVVKYCTKRSIPFTAQNGGNGWGKTFNLGTNGVLINLAGLNAVTFSKSKTEATIGGGVIIGDAIKAANAAGVLVPTGNCNCVGTLGAILGGGYGSLMGEVGFGVDNVLSMRVVIASGEFFTVSPTSCPDLFWAFRGAGPNFGIVTSATVRALPTSTQERTAWTMNLVFSPGQLTQVAQAIQDLPLKPEQFVFLILTNTGPPSNAPAVVVTGFLRKGTEETGRAAFAPLYALGPTANSSGVAGYEAWNTANDAFCARGDRKPGFSTTINHMQPEKWPAIWDMYTKFQAKAPNSAMLIERYNLTKARAAPKGSAALQEALRRDAFAQAIVIPWYTDAALDAEALDFGRKVRDIWSYTETATKNPTYVNFAHGDEMAEAIYGSSLSKLRQLKKTWDPLGVFNQWFKVGA
ncbi:FAD binding domain-containing protein [Colletotrichum graminicola]|uniref:FAD binding domain-containing protein n=1 Tax=Colletotrichum graminicola (strain M1.001 / M2 / FGSC 10212) TaxID=645133 RepID=E3QTZ6_COLGM|nr:FAD binding domain-containing protein [Colletotrichum graminicola M1.001]EFQ34334.1 FAD binding domain-containing protein [Colletotrichum graminicola M1.001]WDK22486.1 FAD binding domain-containing protein [Colletotrichum graminicola]